MVLICGSSILLPYLCIYLIGENIYIVHDIMNIINQSIPHPGYVDPGECHILITTTIVLDDPNAIDIGGAVITGPNFSPHVPVPYTDVPTGPVDIPPTAGENPERQ